MEYKRFSSCRIRNNMEFIKLNDQDQKLVDNLDKIKEEFIKTKSSLHYINSLYNDLFRSQPK